MITIMNFHSWTHRIHDNNFNNLKTGVGATRLSGRNSGAYYRSSKGSIETMAVYMKGLHGRVVSDKPYSMKQCL